VGFITLKRAPNVKGSDTVPQTCGPRKMPWVLCNVFFWTKFVTFSTKKKEREIFVFSSVNFTQISNVLEKNTKFLASKNGFIS
jgi:hypothetical protein